jgi:hypothetical protein
MIFKKRKCRNETCSEIAGISLWGVYKDHFLILVEKAYVD